MNILIRSQNKKYLLNPVSVEIDDEDYVGENYEIYGTTRAEDSYIIGEYSTLDKAPKVIDMIETHEKNHCSCSGAFHMPQDSEVRV